jgi:hypothetical protein
MFTKVSWYSCIIYISDVGIFKTSETGETPFDAHPKGPAIDVLSIDLAIEIGQRLPR